MSPVSPDCDICLYKDQLYALSFSRRVTSNSQRPHKLKHVRLLCLSLAPRTCSNSCPSNWWCHLTILSSAIPFSSCPQSFPVSGSFPINWLFASCGQSIEAHSLNQGFHAEGLTIRSVISSTVIFSTWTGIRDLLSYVRQGSPKFTNKGGKL